ncbi:TetR/AcrR family transcriptional regulator C-terminal domain-containing protein [Bradyrhizobium liaoningense]|uniref:TetR/AcrR family transcriptional regulator C-terminal domain-containing protein n=1 Tax=Bradyrhizobium liaoningense TaxID=43992 RepID=UPI001BAA67A2|nr:TetR/AcrR family transcriptional regulator C-terminal domain-containing protein [Bradyrhizobium liaoningense]MBR0821470.1 TetR/AcrR family transcriptional regulator C-terminal domain-containing protein [Bradyrhizobium liaoningense]
MFVETLVREAAEVAPAAKLELAIEAGITLLRIPKLAKAFYDKGPGRASDRLAEVLEKAKARGEIQIGDCHAAADHFVGMLRDNLHLRVILGLRPPPSAAEAEAVVASTVNIFLYGIYGAKRPQGSKGGAQGR